LVSRPARSVSRPKSLLRCRRRPLSRPQASVSPPTRSVSRSPRHKGRPAQPLGSPAMRSGMKRALSVHREEVLGCRRCESVVGPSVIGPANVSAIYAIGQAPGPHEAKKGRPFGHTAGKALFGWFERIGVDEGSYRERVYIAAVARCFPGKASGQGDRLPNAAEIEACRPFIAREVELLRPELVIPIGRLAIAEVLGQKRFQLKDVVGKELRA